MADIYVFTEEGVSIESFRPKKERDEGGGGGEGSAALGSGQEEEDEDEEESALRKEKEQELLECEEDGSISSLSRSYSSSMPSGFAHAEEEADHVTIPQTSDEQECHNEGEDVCDAANASFSNTSVSNEEEEGDVGSSLDEYFDDDEDGENLNPLTTLIRLAKSKDFHDGEVVIRSLHETLQYVIDSPKDIKTVLDVITSLSTNEEPVLRTDLMEQVPQIAFLCHDNPNKLGDMVSGTLVPMVVNYLTDPSDLVRKTSQAALLVLLEQELVSHKDVEEQVCPVVLDLTDSEAIDFFKIEAVALMSKMAPLVGREMTERYFLQRFTRLCYDSLFQVRKVCAANFGELSGVVGTDGTENVLLPYFLTLCEDGVWGVRKACADVFMVVSCACSLETRKTRLAPLFVSLLSDDSRWVRLAAFQNLGPFISTFADPKVTGLHYYEGILFIGSPPEGGGEQLNQSLDVDSIINCESKYERREHSKNDDEIIDKDFIPTFAREQHGRQHMRRCEVDDDKKNSFMNESSYGCDILEAENEKLGFHIDYSPFLNAYSESSDAQYTCNKSEIVDQLSDSVAVAKPDDDPSYNEHNFWRIPLPEIEIDFLLEDLTLEESVITDKENADLSEEINENSEVQLPDIEDKNVFELNDFSKSEDHHHDHDAKEDDGSSGEEQECEEKLKRVEVESENDLPHKDDVQAELESLAASLAESIFCNDPKSEKSKNFEKIESELCGHLHNHVISAVSSQSLHWSHTRRKCEPSLDALDVTYEEYSFGHSESQSSQSVEEADKDLERGCDNSSYHDEDNSDDDEDSDLLSSSIGESDRRESTEQQEFDSSLFNYSNSLRNRSFNNLSVLPNNDPEKMNMGPPKFQWVATDDSTKDKLTRIQRRKTRSRYKVPSRGGINICQDIVPKTLLEHYISMTHPLRAELVDDEITRHCAYSLPAVAFTLGRRYWSLLRDTYEKLAKDMHWKVRRTLAFSIHELALILGEELAQKDLLPVFEGLIKDLDEVRIGILKNLAHFLKMLPPPQRKLFLPRLSEFLTPDNANNWRFRLELALQLAPISELFSPEECSKHICPITFDLMADKVVEIRRTCFVVVSQLAKQLMDEEGNCFIVPFSNKLIEEFAQADTWTKRQSFAYVVGQIIKDSSLPLPIVYSLLLPKFLELSSDRVANIRLVVARIINTIILTRDCPDSEVLDKVRETLFALQRDSDRDVQYFASLTSNTEVMEGQDSNFY